MSRLFIIIHIAYLHTPLNEESCDSVLGLCRIRIGLGVHHQGVSIGPVCDPKLGPVEDVVVALLLRGGLHADHIRPRASLTHRQGPDVFSTAKLREILLLLCLRAIPENANLSPESHFTHSFTCLSD